MGHTVGELVHAYASVTSNEGCGESVGAGARNEIDIGSRGILSQGWITSGVGGATVAG